MQQYNVSSVFLPVRTPANLAELFSPLLKRAQRCCVLREAAQEGVELSCQIFLRLENHTVLAVLHEFADAVEIHGAHGQTSTEHIDDLHRQI